MPRAGTPRRWHDEVETLLRVISPWVRDHLLLNV
jgi:hypothetical protein